MLTGARFFKKTTIKKKNQFYLVSIKANINIFYIYISTSRIFILYLRGLGVARERIEVKNTTKTIQGDTGLESADHEVYAPTLAKLLVG